MKKYHEDVPPELLLEFGLKRFQQERGMELLKEVGRRIMQAKLDIAMDHWRLFVANEQARERERAALILECAVRCWLARQECNSRRAEQEAQKARIAARRKRR